MVSWSESDNKVFIEFMISKKEEMMALFYKNIIYFIHLFRRKNQFFNEMATKTQKTIKQCKSKFQKMEKHIFLEVYKIPKEHFLLYMDLQKQRRYLYKHKILLNPDKIIPSPKLIKLIKSHTFQRLMEKRRIIYEELLKNFEKYYISENDLGIICFLFLFLK